MNGGSITRAWSWLGQRRRLSLVLVGLLGFCLAAAPSLVRLPEPRVHDEFSYVLAADTFAQGRAANPPHGLWEHFESFHILQQPTYASKYPPAQGLVLMLGQRLGGHPIVGVWLVHGLAAAAFCWMLQGWVPARWALVGGILLALHSRIQFAWGYSYWGGAVALLGAALMWGAYARLVREPRWRDGVWLALGLLLLANSRPFEGLVASVPVAAALGVWLARAPAPRRRELLVRAAAPCGLLLAAGAVAMGWYNQQVTGHPLRMPYQVHEAAYSVTPMFLWQPPRPEPVYRHAELREFWLGWAMEKYHRQRSLSDSWRLKWQVPGFFVTPALALSLLALPCVVRRQRTGLLLGALVLSLAASLTVPACHPHYLAPVAPLLLWLVVQGLREMRTWRLGQQLRGAALVAMVLVAQCLAYVQVYAVHLRHAPSHWAVSRAALVRRLDEMPGRHVVLVRYGAAHNVHAEWVYNAADIDAAKVVWARDLGAERNERLADYFRDRRLWYLDADAQPPQLTVWRPAPAEGLLTRAATPE